jgi:opacity protein-like surface antigen
MRVKFLGASAAAVVAVLAHAGAAQAADYGIYSDPMPSAPAGWYFSGFGGVNWLKDTVFDIDDGVIGIVSVDNDYDAGFVAGGAVGYDMGDMAGPVGLRLEAEFSYRDNDVKSHSVNGGPPNELGAALGSTSVFAGMANMLFDVDTGTPISLYGGGGIGVANVAFDGHGVDGIGVVLDDDDTVFAWQLIAGAGYEIMPGLVADLQYRYFRADGVSLTSEDTFGPVSASTDYESQSVMMGLRWSM